MIIPEVNELFKELINEGGLWYYRKQVERYQLSLGANKVIFDGDPFQPLWYNWSYNFPENYLPLERVYDFYRHEIEKEAISFPDLYILFFTNIEKLRERKERDQTRRRSNFVKHLKLTKTQPKYFGFMKEKFPNLVEFIEFDSISQVKAEIDSVIANREHVLSYESKEILNRVVDWLSMNKS